MVAMAGIYALENNISRLELDHKNARRLEEGLASLKGFEVESALSTNNLATNLVFFSMKDPNQIHPFLEKCTQKGVRFSQVGENRIRAVTHLDVSQNDIETALRTVKEIVG
jgi:threonine aldolase